MDRKKELKQQYKLMKPRMGLFMVRCRTNNKCYLHATQDLRGVMNGAKVRLASGGHPYRELQKEYTELGADQFTIEILEELEYNHDETKTDYSDELEILKMLWEEKLAAEGLEFYQKRSQT